MSTENKEVDYQTMLLKYLQLILPFARLWVFAYQNPYPLGEHEACVVKVAIVDDPPPNAPPSAGPKIVSVLMERTGPSPNEAARRLVKRMRFHADMLGENKGECW